MYDPKIRDVQIYYNVTYGDLTGTIPASGETGWTTVNALIRALQYELGISPQVDAYGPGTHAAIVARAPLGPSTDPSIVTLYQCALWCKGYWGGDLDGVWGPVVEAATSSLATDAGIGVRTTAPATLVRALFNMDAYVVPPGSGGTGEVQEVQRWINSRRWANPSYVLSPCDGSYSRAVQRAFVYSLQYELGISDASTTGTVGPSTRTGLKTLPGYGLGSSDSGTGKTWIRHLQGLMRLNGLATPFDGVVSSTTQSSVGGFRGFVGLPPSSTSDGALWLELLVSTGDIDRVTSGFDTATRLTPIAAAALRASGYTAVGRYIKQTDDHPFALTHVEARVIASSGIGLWLYFQSTGGTSSTYFTLTQGRADARRAFQRASELGYGGATIFFAVDYDSMLSDVQFSIKPYFEGVQDECAKWSSRADVEFSVGIYAPRAIGQRIHDLGLASSIAVSGMSWAYSGNLGVSMPADWDLNQIHEYTHSSGVAIDKVVVRSTAPILSGGRAAPSRNAAHDCIHTMLGRLQALCASGVLSPISANLFNLGRLGSSLAWEQYLSGEPGTEAGANTGSFELFLGTDPDLLPLLPSGVGLVPATADTAYWGVGSLGHFGVTLGGYGQFNDWGSDTTVGLADLGGWALDLVQLWNTLFGSPGGLGDIAGFVDDVLGVGEQDASFDLADLKADTDAFNVAYDVRNGSMGLADAIDRMMQEHASWDGLARFLGTRFDDSAANLEAAVKYLFTADWTPWIEYPVQQFLSVRKPTTSELSLFAAAVAGRLFDLAAS